MSTSAITSTDAPDADSTDVQAERMLFGSDPTPGIVSVQASYSGQVRMWRRLADGGLVVEEDRFYPWLLLSALTLLDGQSIPVLGPAEPPAVPEGEVMAAVSLKGEGHYRYLLLGRSFDLLQQALLEPNSGGGLRDLRDDVYYRPAVDQYLTLTGRTYYKGMLWTDLRRMQLDLETTSLSSADGEIFMASLHDSTGWETVLDSSTCGGERGLLRQLADTVQERDPDVIEGHNIFEFDLPFMLERSRRLDVPLALGRLQDAPVESRDQLKVGARNEPFRRFSVAGREIIDTLHAVKRRDAIVHDIRSYGLKSASKYFGLASDDREYVEGPEIHATWLADPERVRRYALDDVREVDTLSTLLMASSFALASMVPRPYERIATAGTGQGLIEPLLVRAYLREHRALPKAGTASSEERYIGGYTRMFRSGILPNVVKADVASLYPSIMLSYGIYPRTDTLRAFPALLARLTQLRLKHKALGRQSPEGSGERTYHDAMQGAMKMLINSFYGSMGTGFALFGDIAAATQVTRTGQEILARMLRALDSRGMTLIEADTDGVYFSVPEGWTYEDELRLVEEVGRELPEGISVEHDGRFCRMYSYQEKNYILQGYDGKLKLVGAAFRSSRNEPYGERFFNEALPLLLEGDFQGVRDVFDRAVDALRRRETPVEDLTVMVQLTKSEEAYAQAGRAEEQYEVLRAAGVHWKPGDRVRYYQAARGRKKLYEPGAADYDAEYYIRKLRDTYTARLSRAVAPEDLNSLFGEMRGLFDRDPSDIRPVVTVEAELEA